MVVAPPTIDVARTIVHLSTQVHDTDLEREFANLTAACGVTDAETSTTEYFADVRFRGQSHELKIPVIAMTMSDISRRFHPAYRAVYGRPPTSRAIEIVTLRVRRIGHAPDVQLPKLQMQVPAHSVVRETRIIDPTGETVRAAVLTRPQLSWAGRQAMAEIKRRGLKPDQVIVTTLDADHRPHLEYFAALTYRYVLTPEPRHAVLATGGRGS